jgi:phosphatidylserine synthase 2
MGQHTWLLLATIGTELLAIIKWSKGQFEAPLPTHVWLAWLIVAAMLLLYPVGQVSSHATTFFCTRALSQSV